jgi:hypothetical protein
MNKRNVDAGLTADRISAHQIRNGADKAVKRMLNRGIGRFLYVELPKAPVAEVDFTATEVLPLARTLFPNVSRVEISSALAGLAKGSHPILKRVGGVRSGIYALRTPQERVARPTAQPTVDEAVQAVLGALETLVQLAHRGAKLERRMEQLGITIKTES